MDPNVFETANAGFAQAIYEEYLRDPSGVSPEWRRLFESGVTGAAPDYLGNGNGTGWGPAPRTEPAPPPADSAATPTPPAVQALVAALPTPAAAAPGAVPIKGPAARLAANMNESLRVPTATTFRQTPVAELEARRRELNESLKAAGRTEKVSFTHLIAFALVQAARKHPVMGTTYAEIDGNPHRIERGRRQPGPGGGRGTEGRKPRPRGPGDPRCGEPELLRLPRKYEDLVEKARTNRLLPDAFAGATMSLTNPGGLGTSASVPRLMAGQGSIIAVGSIAYPPEFAAHRPGPPARDWASPR